MMNAADLIRYQRLCEARVEECFVIAEEKFGMKIPRPRITWSNQMKKCAGSARSRAISYEPVEIKLSNAVLALNGDTFLGRTPGHEAAHCIANFVFKTQCGHGDGWIKIMHLLGQKAERCHDMDVLVKDAVILVCDCKEHKVAAKRATRLLNNGGFCRSCRGKLRKAFDQSAVVEINQKVAAVKTAVKVAAYAKAAQKPVAKKVKAGEVPQLTKPVTKKKSGAPTFASICRAIVNDNRFKTIEQVVEIVCEKHPNEPKGKVKSYVRHIMKVEMKLV